MKASYLSCNLKQIFDMKLKLGVSGEVDIMKAFRHSLKLALTSVLLTFFLPKRSETKTRKLHKVQTS